MTIAAINEKLLRSIGVGVAILDGVSHEIIFANKPFCDWFGTPDQRTRMSELVEELSPEDLGEDEAEGRVFTGEVELKRKRRTLVIAVSISATRSGDQRLLVVECQNITRIRELESMIDSYSTMVERNTRELEREKERVEKLLLNLMPRSVYEEFKTFGVVTPQLYTQVSVVMLDFVDFTEFATKTDPTVTLAELNDIFTAFDRIVEQYGCERIKTIGDAYLAVSGMPDPAPEHASAVAHCAVRFLRYLERRNESHQHTWRARIGLGTGAAVGSVVGIQKYVYDVFGPAVNMASRLQMMADPMGIVAPEEMKFDLIDEFQISDFGEHQIKGLGEMDLITVEANLRPAHIR
ncbi:adenylate/guanylate cyclase domain-containing protein [Falsiruegeria mediterranea]|jgi:adenylate cyclase